MASVHRVRGLFPSALHYLDKQVLTEQLHTNPLGEILYNVPRAADKWNSYATWEYKRLCTQIHTLSLTHTNTEAWHTENLTKQRSLMIITGSESKRKTYKCEKWSVKMWRSLTFPWTQTFVSLYAKIILLGFKRHKITGWEIIVHKRTLDTCGHDQNTWLKKMKAFNSQLRPLETARWVQTQHGIDTDEKNEQKRRRGKCEKDYCSAKASE